jgi:hypothetical protein
MALRVGKNDAFERKYMGKFGALAAQFGEFAKYERDRAGRDIGLHFVEAKTDGGEIVTPSLVWFQMKGIQASTLTEAEFREVKKATVQLEVSHLRFWYIAPDPTFLAVYVESVDDFLVLNLKRYVAGRFGNDILTLDQKTVSVDVSDDSVLDEQAFYLIKKNQSVEAWKDKIEQGDEFAHTFFRDTDVIWRLGDIADRGASASMVVRKYGSKMRTEVYFLEVKPGDDDELIRQHWQFAMGDDLRTPFPYLDFDTEDDEDADWWADEDDWDATGHPALELPNGKIVQPSGVFEMVEYRVQIALNDIGKAWLQTLRIMEASGFIEINKESGGSVSVAPWHGRNV